MNPTLPPIHEVISDDGVVILTAGTSENHMSYRLRETPQSITSTSWSQPIPEEMARDEAEYYALIKGLEKTIEMDYSNVIVNTRYEPITGKLRDGYTPPDELKKFHESVVQLIEQFNKVDVNPKPWKR